MRITVTAGFGRCVLALALSSFVALAHSAIADKAQAAGTAARSAAATCLSLALDRLHDQNPAAISISLAIVPVSGSEAWADAAGFADRIAGTPATDTTGYRIASITKTYTAAAILRLSELGRLDVDDAIEKHLPVELRAVLATAGYDTSAIRIRHLLSHTSGLREHVSEAFIAQLRARPERVWTPLELIRLAAEAGPPLGPPGERFAYSDSGYILLGQIIERVHRSALPVAVAELLNWSHGGGEEAWWEGQPGTSRSERAHQYWDGEDTYGWNPSFDLYGGGGIVATPTAVAEFLRALLRGEVYARPETLATQRALGLDGAWNDYSAGLFEITVRGVRLVGHSGFWNTFVFASGDLVLAGATGEKNSIKYPALLEWLVDRVDTCHFRQ